MAVPGIDIAWERPTIAQIKATGAQWVARYLSPDHSKNLTAAEVHDYPAAGLAIVTVYESTAGRATQGRAAGVADARLAESQRSALGLPADHVHHFAVDSDVSWDSVRAYFDGAASVVGPDRTGCYGGLHVIQGAHAHGIRYLWQTVAWSGGVWFPQATIRQPGGTLLAGAADVDYAEATDFGQYPRPVPEDIVTPADIAAVAAAVWNHTELNVATDTQVRMGAVLRYSDFVHTQQTRTLTAQIGALSAAVAALAKAAGSPTALTAAQIQSAAQAGATAALTQLDGAHIGHQAAGH
jgi:hypothetical protein